jgi:hypothetical protein
LTVKGWIPADTNIFDLTIRGLEPLMVRNFAGAVSAETVNYVNNLINVFELRSRDHATSTTAPDRPGRALTLYCKLIFRESERYLPRTKNHIESRVKLVGGKILFGVNDGGVSAFRAVTLYPEHFRSITALTGWAKTGR